MYTPGVQNMILKSDTYTENDFDLFSYANYRNLLHDLIELKKAQRSGFSYRMFAQRAGFSSPSYLKLVLDGERNLSKDSIKKFISFFKLVDEEAHFFTTLVNYNQSKQKDEKEKHWQSLEKIVHVHNINRMNINKGEYFSKWYHVMIREAIQNDNFTKDPKKLFDIFHGQIEIKDIERALQLIHELDLVEIDKKGKFKQKDTTIWWNHRWENLYVKIFYRQMIEKALHALDFLSLDQRYFGSMTFAFSKDKIMDIKKMIKKFQEDLITYVDNNKDIKKNEVYQLNTQLFPLINIKDDKAL